MALVQVYSGPSASGPVGGNTTPAGFDLAWFSNLVYRTATEAVFGSTSLGARTRLRGTGFIYDASGRLAGGTITSLERVDPDAPELVLSGISVPVATLDAAIQSNQAATFLTAALAGNDRIFGS